MNWEKVRDFKIRDSSNGPRDSKSRITIDVRKKELLFYENSTPGRIDKTYLDLDFKRYQYKFVIIGPEYREIWLSVSRSGDSVIHDKLGTEILIDPKESYYLIAQNWVTDSDVTLAFYRMELNAPPTLTDSTANNKTFYENDIISLAGSVKDTDVGDVISVKYKINNGTARAIASGISNGSTPLAYNKSLKYSNKRLMDGKTDVSGLLAEGSQNSITIWSEDDKGGKSTEVTRVFYVVHNRPPTLAIEPFNPSSDLINTDIVTVNGSVSDPDGGNIKVKYKIGNSAYTEIHNGVGGTFQFQVLLSKLVDGTNTITIQSEDTYGAITSKSMTLTKTKNEIPLKTAVARYKLTPPNGSAKGIVLWLEREVGDLIVDVEVSMENLGVAENFKPMTKSSTAFVREGIEEDEFTFDNSVAKTNIILKITMTRTSASSNKGITLVSGVLS